MRLAASRTFWTAGSKRPMRLAMIAITTSNSISVNPRRVRSPSTRMAVLEQGCGSTVGLSVPGVKDAGRTRKESVTGSAVPAGLDHLGGGHVPVPRRAAEREQLAVPDRHDPVDVPRGLERRG